LSLAEAGFYTKGCVTAEQFTNIYRFCIAGKATISFAPISSEITATYGEATVRDDQIIR
jgi:hypothetical protein